MTRIAFKGTRRRRRREKICDRAFLFFFSIRRVSKFRIFESRFFFFFYFLEAVSRDRREDSSFAKSMTRVPFSLPMEGVSKFRIFQSRFFFFYFLISGKDDRMLRLKNLEERIYPSRNSIFRREDGGRKFSFLFFSKWKAFRNFEFFKIASSFSLEETTNRESWI